MRLHTFALFCLLSLSNVVNGGVVRHCLGLEGDIGEFTPYVEVHSEHGCTVLAAHINYFNGQSVNDMAMDATVPVPEVTYPLSIDEGHPTFNESCVSNKPWKTEFDVINTHLDPGETLIYNATFPGVYCIVVHQDGESAEDGLSITAFHSYGSEPLTNFLWAKLILLLSCVYVFHRFGVPLIFPRMGEGHKNETMWDQLKVALIAKILVGVRIGFFSVIRYSNDHEPRGVKNGVNASFQYDNVWYLLHHAISLVVITTVCRTLVGLFEEPTEGTATEKLRMSRFRGHLLCVQVLLTFIVIFFGINLPIFYYSLLSDLEIARYAQVLSMTIVQAKISSIIPEEAEAEQVISEEERDILDRLEFTRHLFLFVLFLVYCLSGVLYLLCKIEGFGLRPTTALYHRPIGMPMDPRTSYTYVIMWTFACNWLFSLLPNVVQKYSLLLLNWLSSSISDLMIHT